MNGNPSADEWGFIGRDRVCEAVQEMLRAAQARGWDDNRLGAAAGLKPRYIKALRVENKVPNLAAALCIASALGKWAMSMLLSTVGYTGAPMDEVDERQPLQIVAETLSHFAVIGRAASDNRIDHIEEPDTRAAADAIIAEMIPLSSHGRAA